MSDSVKMNEASNKCTICNMTDDICGILLGPISLQNQVVFVHMNCLYFCLDVWIDYFDFSSQLETLQLQNRYYIKSCFFYPHKSLVFDQNIIQMITSRLRNAEAAIKRSSKMTCVICHTKGASVKCLVYDCNSVYHYSCAIKNRRGHFFQCGLAAFKVYINRL